MAAITTRNLLEKAYDIANISIPSTPLDAALEEQLYAHWRAGARDFVDKASKVRPDLLTGIVTRTSADSSVTTGVNIGIDSVNTITSVMRNSYPCSQISQSETKFYDGTTSGSIYEATIINPVFYIDTGTANQSLVKVLPLLHSSIDVDHVNYTNIDAAIIGDQTVANQSVAGVTSVNNLPTLAETTMCTYLAIKILGIEISNFLTAGDYNNAIDKSEKLIDDLTKNSVAIDVESRISDDETELASVALATAKQELDRAMGSLKELENLEMRKNRLMQEYFAVFGASEKEDEK